MFTGLIETIGTITEVHADSTGAQIAVKPDSESFAVAEGGSVAIDGVCLTLEKSVGGVMYFTAVRETLARSTFSQARRGRRVNLERALAASGRFDGHIVLGHVDDMGVIKGDCLNGVGVERTIEVPRRLRMFMAEKGSVAIDGISLTIASCADAERSRSDETAITVALVPHTMKNTTMHLKKAGERVNIECDVVARYLHRFLTVGESGRTTVDKSAGNTLLADMERLGF